MRMWKFIALISMVLWAASTTQNASAESGAEPKGAPVMKQASGAQGKDPVTKHLESMTKRLGLSAEQQAEIKPILLDEAVKVKELRADVKLTTDEKKAKVLELHDETYNRIRPILSAEQQQKHDTLLKEVTERRKNKERK